MAGGHIPFVVVPSCDVRMPPRGAGASSPLLLGSRYDLRSVVMVLGILAILGACVLSALTVEPHLKMSVLMSAAVVPTIAAPISTGLVTVLLTSSSLASVAFVLIESAATLIAGVVATIVLSGVVIVPAVAIGLLGRYVHRVLESERTRNGEDPMTTLLNRRGFHRRVSALLGEALDGELWVGILLMDIDEFKRFNDRYGHVAGDMAIIATARALAEAPLADVAVCRYGGEEFLVFGLLDDEADFDRMRTVYGDAVSRGLPVTLSIGGACMRMIRSESSTAVPLGGAMDRLIDRADRCTYQAKTTRQSSREPVGGEPGPA